MRTIQWYVETAMKNGGFSSMRKLAAHMDITVVSMSQWINHKNYPSSENMIKLAELANVEPEIAICDLGEWMNFDTPVKDVFTKIKETLTKAQNAAAVLLVACAMSFNSSDIDGGSSAPLPSASSPVEYILW